MTLRHQTAPPVDIRRFGTYRAPVSPHAGGRQRFHFANRPSEDGRTVIGRYHLYVALSNWTSHRALLSLVLRGLDEVITWSAVDPQRDGRGWAFREGLDHGPDPINGFRFVREAYLATDRAYDGHISVPMLWDRTGGRIASNDIPSLIVDLQTRLERWADPSVDLYPRRLRGEIDELNASLEHRFVVSHIGDGLSLGPTDVFRTAVLDEMDALDRRLAARRFLHGDAITDSDLVLFTNLVRFDAVIAPTADLPRDLLLGYEHLWGYARDLYHRVPFSDTTNFDHIRRRVMDADPTLATAVIPDRAWSAAHARG